MRPGLLRVAIDSRHPLTATIMFRNSRVQAELSPKATYSLLPLQFPYSASPAPSFRLLEEFDYARSNLNTRGQAFWRVTFPQARRGLVTAGTLAWARAVGEFGPVFVLCHLHYLHALVRGIVR